MKIHNLLVPAILLLAGLNSCCAPAQVRVGGHGHFGGGSEIQTNTRAHLQTITLSPSTVSQIIGSQAGYTATGHYSNGFTVNLTKYTTWGTSNAAIAFAASLTDTKNFTCSSPGTVLVTASFGNVSGSASLTCAPAPPLPPTLSTIAVTPAALTVNVGLAVGYTATGTYSDASTQNVTAASTWVSSAPTVAAIGTLATLQNVTCLTAGTATITATDGAVSGNTTITCVAVLSSLTVTPASPSTTVGTATGFIATGHYSDGSSVDVTLQATWTSGTPATATVGALADPQPVSCIAAGTSVIMAAIGSVSGVTTLTCTNPGPPIPTLSSIIVTPASPSVNVGQNLGFVATGVYSDSSTKDVTLLAAWTSGTPAVGALGVAADPQLVTCATAGTSLITATISAVSGNTTLTCQNPPPTLSSIAVVPAAPSISVGTSLGFSAIGTFSDASTKDVTAIATWASLTPAAASLGALGTQQSVNCLTAGTSAIQATVNAVNGSSTLTCNATLTSILITPTNPSLDTGTSTAFVATGTYSDGTQKNVSSQATWSTSAPLVASLGTLTSSQPANCLTVGSSTIGAAVGTVNASTLLTCVNPPPPPPVLTVITVTPASPSVNVGQSLGFIATGTYSDGSTQNLTTTAVWASASPSVATLGTVTTVQNATCVTAGTSSISAAFTGITGSTTLTCVTPAPTLSSIAVKPASPSVTVGSGIGFIATGTFSDGSTQDLTATSVWTSGTPSHATIGTLSTTQAVNCIAAGTSVITATKGAVSGNTTLTCVALPPTLSSITLTPANPSQLTGSAINFTATGTFSDGSSQNVSASATWTSSSSIATLGTLGTTQAVNCVSAGTSTIKAQIGLIAGTTVITCTTPPPPNTSAMDLYCGAGNVPAFGATDGPAALPSTCYYTDPTARPSNGTIRPVTATTWNSVWAAAACGDIIEIAQGTTLSGSFTIPLKVCDDTHYLTLRVQNFNLTFPKYGTRVSPCFWGVASMAGYPNFNCNGTTNRGATLQSTGTNPTLIFTAGSSHIQVEGVKITRTAGSGFIGRLIVADVGVDHLIFDRDWCAATAPDETTRCIATSKINYFAFIGSLGTDFFCRVSGNCSDAQVISDGLSGSATQDHTKKIVNNFCSATAQGCLLSGGGGSASTPTDFEFRLNWTFKPMTWNPADPSYAGVSPQVKNNLEFKNIDHFFGEGNVFQNVWEGFSQDASMIVVTPKNPGNTQCPTCYVNNVVLRYNYSTASNYGIQVASLTNIAGANSYSFHDNVFDNMGYPTCSGCGGDVGNGMDGGYLTGSTSTQPLHDVTYNHNDFVLATGAHTKAGTLGISGPLLSSGHGMSNYKWTNNLAMYEAGGSLGIANPSAGCGAGTTNCACVGGLPSNILNACFVGASYTFAGNVLVANGTHVWPGTNCLTELSYGSAFVNYNNGVMLPSGDFHIKPTSVCHNTGTDGKDPGADINTLLNRIAGVNTF